MKRRANSAGSFLLGVMTLACFSACEPVPFKTLTSDQKRADMFWLYSQFDENYAPLEYKMNLYGFDFKDLKRDYLQKALKTKTNEQFYEVMHRFIAEFRDAHTIGNLNHGGMK